MPDYVTTIVVTHNRRNSLCKCVYGLLGLNQKLQRILFVDNASTDQPHDALGKAGLFDESCMTYLILKTNLGGAGGFHWGMRYAYEKTDCDWFWLMDDDAIAHPDALAELMRVAVDEGNLYGSTPVCGSRLSWAVTIRGQSGKHRLEEAAFMPDHAAVEFLPFIGLLVHRRLVQKIGFPDPGYFIAADDFEYSVRARKAGAKIIQAGRSRIEHPPASTYSMRILGKTLYGLKLPPWKRYYDTRNRLLLARAHFGGRFYTETIPSLIPRLIGTILNETRKSAQIFAFIAGVIDGLLGFKGPRHTRWHISS
jgi:GT2 family glycosyltransferase